VERVEPSICISRSRKIVLVVGSSIFHFKLPQLFSDDLKLSQEELAEGS